MLDDFFEIVERKSHEKKVFIPPKRSNSMYKITEADRKWASRMERILKDLRL